MNVVTWAHGRMGQRVTAPGGLGGQCVDLCNLWAVANMAAPVRADATDWWHPHTLPGWTWEPNGPVNVPPLGAIVVWRGNVTREGIGSDGHVAIAIAGDASTILSLDQNWPDGAQVALVWHNYRGVLGWWIPPR